VTIAVSALLMRALMTRDGANAGRES
jgi:hypothetical protein